MHLLYSMALGFALVVTLPWWLLQMLRHGKYRAGLAERFGRVPSRLAIASATPRSIWVHAVSVGEVLAVSGLVAKLRERFPEHRVVISTTTATGQKLARDRFGAENVFYFPLDFAFAIRPYSQALQPELVVVAETEFWPNFLRLAHASGARIAVVNARISDRSYPRYLKLRRLTARVLRHIDLFLAQTDEDARRLHGIGAAADRVHVSGNLKFDVAPPKQAPFAEQLKQRLTAARAWPVLVCGSTVENEELVILHAFQVLQSQYPDALMVLAPRHPERFKAVAELAEAFAGIKVWLRSTLPDDALLRGGVLLLDTIGELASVYSVATIALVGGSLAPRGGHNILEPAYYGVPILVGPHTENFRDIVTIFRANDAVRVVHAFREGDRKGDLGATFLELAGDPAQCAALGRRALETLRSQTGATERTMDALTPLLASSRDAQVTRR